MPPKGGTAAGRPCGDLAATATLLALLLEYSRRKGPPGLDGCAAVKLAAACIGKLAISLHT